MKVKGIEFRRKKGNLYFSPESNPEEKLTPRTPDSGWDAVGQSFRAELGITERKSPDKADQVSDLVIADARYIRDRLGLKNWQLSSHGSSAYCLTTKRFWNQRKFDENQIDMRGLSLDKKNGSWIVICTVRELFEYLIQKNTYRIADDIRQKQLAEQGGR